MPQAQDETLPCNIVVKELRGKSNEK